MQRMGVSRQSRDFRDFWEGEQGWRLGVESRMDFRIWYICTESSRVGEMMST